MTARQKTLALLTLIIALVLEIVDLTIVNTALPAIKVALDAGATAAQWIVAGYSLSFAFLLMAGGRMGDSYGYRRMFILGVTGFTLSSVACGLAANAEQLVAARMLQGATGAIMGPQFMALLQIMFKPLERVSKLAMFGIIGGIAAISGPIIGGLLIKANVFELGWRIIFLINLPIGAGAVLAAYFFLPEARSTRPAGFDLVGTALFGGAVAAALWPLMGANAEGWAWQSWASLGAAPFLCLLGWRHTRSRTSTSRSALFDPALFQISTFRLGLAMSLAFAAANAGFLFIFAFALQNERGQTPLVSGLLHMPFGLGVMFGIGVLGRTFLPRFGRWVLVGGGLLMAISTMLVLTAITLFDWNWAMLVPVLVLAGIGMGTTSGCISPITVAQVGNNDAGAASGLLKTTQQLGSAVGIALAGSAYFVWGRQANVPPMLMASSSICLLLVICAFLASRLPQDIFSQSSR